MTNVPAIRDTRELLYPIIVARINEAHPLSRADLRMVTIRIFLEIGSKGASRFRQLRHAARIAHAALGIAALHSPTAERRGTSARPSD